MPRSHPALPLADRLGDRLGDRLDHEWQRLRADPVVVRRAATWHLTAVPPRDLDDVLAAVGFRAPATAATEAALRRLVATAAFDPLAGRVALQRLLPALVAAARRAGQPTDVALDELVGAAWISITTFDATRSPACLAAALVGDAEHRAFRAAARRAGRGERVADVDFDALASDDAGADTLQELACVFRLARTGGVAPDDLDLLRRLITADRAEDVATELRVTSRTIRNRRARITDRLRELAA